MTSFTIDDLAKGITDEIAAAIDTHDIAAARAVSYAITSSAGHLSGAAQAALALIAEQIGQLLVKLAAESDGDPEHWRIIAALALQLEARAMGVDYTSCMNDKALTTD